MSLPTQTTDFVRTDDPDAVPMGDEQRWQAVLARDARADGLFVYSVRSTGVFCRPSCPSRPARRDRVAFHDTPAQAIAAGFRACLRCHPMQADRGAQQAQRVVRACRRLEADGPSPTLEELAREAGLSPYHFHRLFKSVTGLTPRAYAKARLAERVRQQLPAATSVTAALYDAGYRSNARFYADSRESLGMTPQAYRRGGADERIRFAVGQCALGAILVAATDRGVCAISLGDEPEALLRELQDRFPHATLVGADPDFEAMVARVVGWLESPGRRSDAFDALPLDIRGTAFQQRVWAAVRAIPPGTTITYTELAQRLGLPRSVRAVAAASAANTLALAIPCHRVIRRDGSLAGYRWGIERKRALIDRERAAR